VDIFYEFRSAVMHILTTSPDFNAIVADLENKPWLIACLCAGWCDTCESYKEAFAQFSSRNPDQCFAWIDIEDQADLVEQVDIDNFPMMLIEHSGNTLFLGSMLPDTAQLEKLIRSLQEASADPSSTEKNRKSTFNLRAILQNQLK
jgi:thioredoxin 1